MKSFIILTVIVVLTLGNAIAAIPGAAGSDADDFGHAAHRHHGRS